MPPPGGEGRHGAVDNTSGGGDVGGAGRERGGRRRTAERMTKILRRGDGGRPARKTRLDYQETRIREGGEGGDCHPTVPLPTLHRVRSRREGT